jgi:hypothetical protein
MMNEMKHLRRSVPLLMAAALCASTPVLPAQAQETAPPPSQQQEAPPPQQGQQQEAQPQVKTYTGKIMKLQNGNFALVTGQSTQGQAAGHFLDNQDEAKKYEGKEVRVTGTLEMASNTIHVTKIESAA